MYPEVHKVSKRLRAPEEVEVDEAKTTKYRTTEKEAMTKGKTKRQKPLRTAIYPISVTCDHGRRPGYLAGYLLKTVSHPCGLKVTDRLTDVSVDVLPVLAGTVLVRAVSCPGLHPTVDVPGLHPTVDPLAGWPKASDEHVLKQTALTPSFARGSRLQTTPKGRKAKATCKGPPGQPERTSCAVKRMAIKGRPKPPPLDLRRGPGAIV